MRTTIQYLQGLLIYLTLLTSCVSTTAVEEIENTVKSNDNTPGGYLVVEIQNNANNTCLEIDSIELCNTATGIITITRHTNALQLTCAEQATCPKLKLAQQTLVPWDPQTLPELSRGTYAKIYGRIYTNLQQETPFLLSDTPMYTPISGQITDTRTTTTIISLHNNCPIYIINNSTAEKVLQEIQFEPYVREWE